jgi:serine/threonine-protein kinase
MSISTAAGLLEAVQVYRLLEPERLQFVTRSLAGRFGDPRALAKELIRRGWLTPYQVNQVFLGKGADLVLGQYILLERLGEGGMGQVFKARQTRLDRVVALKLIRRDFLNNPETVRRFHREIQAAAQLHHPNIILSFDADQAGQTHFFVMEYVDGINLSQLVKRTGRLSIAQACAYVAQAAAGLQYVHAHGLVHRDIKPSNLLATQAKAPATQAGHTEPEFEKWTLAFGLVKLLDLGMARLQPEADDGSPSTLTREGSMMGTPDFISPEQARNAKSADIRSDIYSLGCTFFYLLAGRVVFPGGSLTEKLLQHQMDEPTPIRELRPEVSEELAALLRKMMAKKPQDRYEEPSQVIEAIKVLPLISKRPSPQVPAEEMLGGSERASARLRRRQAAEARRWLRLVGAGAAVLVAGLLLLAFLSVQASRPVEEPVARAVPLEPAAAALKQALALTDVDQQRPALFEVRRDFPGTPEALKAAETLTALRSPFDRIEADKISSSDRLWLTQRDVVMVFGEQRRRLWGPVNAVAFSRDGQSLIAGGPSPSITVWDVARDQVSKVVNVGPVGVQCLAYGPQGKSWAAGCADGWVHLFGNSRGRLDHKLSSVNSLAWSPDGELLATVTHKGDLHVWQVERREERYVVSAHDGHAMAVAWSPDGRWLASSGFDKIVRLAEASTGKMVALLKGHQANVAGLSWSSDSKLLASASADRTIRIWDVADRKEVRRFENLGAVATAVAFAPDGRRLASGGLERNVSIWNVDTGQAMTQFAHESGVTAALAWSPDGRTVVVGCTGGTFRLWDAATGQEQQPLQGHLQSVLSVAVTQDGSTLASAGADGIVQLWSSTGKPLASLRHNQGAELVRFAPDAKTLASVGHDATLLWDMPTVLEGKASARAKLARVRSQGVIMPGLDFSPDGTTVVAGGPERQVQLWQVATGAASQMLSCRERVKAAAYAPDGQTLATLDTDGNVLIFDASTGHEQGGFATKTHHPRNLVFLPDGKSLATVSGDEQAVRIWDAFSGRERVAMAAPVDAEAIDFSLDGKRLATCGRSGKVAIWDVASGERQRQWEMPGTVHAVAFTPDGRHLLTANANGSVYVLRLAAHPGRAR